MVQLNQLNHIKKVLMQAVKRNVRRFPSDFMFRMENQEVVTLRSQFVTSRLGYGFRRYNPCAFTEQRVAMLNEMREGWEKVPRPICRVEPAKRRKCRHGR